jgi:hypothetical protein
MSLPPTRRGTSGVPQLFAPFQRGLLKCECFPRTLEALSGPLLWCAAPLSLFQVVRIDQRGRRLAGLYLFSRTDGTAMFAL